MSPPEVWGPAVWTLFHTFAEKINEADYPYVSHSLFKMIVRICKFLPCPECSSDASKFLAKIKMSDLKNKSEFKNTFYLFHNYVNAKKRKRLFNSANMPIYGKYRLIDVVNNFISKYHTKGNMKLLTESFQRQLVIKEFKGWFSSYIKAFVPRVNIPARITNTIQEATSSVPSEATSSEATSSEATSSVQSETTVNENVAQEDLELVSEEKIYENENVNEEMVSAVSEATVSEATASETTVSEATEREATEREATEREATESEATESEATASVQSETKEPLNEEIVASEMISEAVSETTESEENESVQSEATESEEPLHTKKKKGRKSKK